MLHALLDESAGLPPARAQYFVGDEIPLPPGPQPFTMRKPDGTEASVAAGGKFNATDQPGIYIANPGELRFVVNLDPGESRTSPLAPDSLAALALPIGDKQTSVTAEDAGIHAAATEAEQKQKLWRWLVIAAVIFLMVETAVAAKLSAAQRNSRSPHDSASAQIRTGAGCPAPETSPPHAVVGSRVAGSGRNRIRALEIRCARCCRHRRTWRCGAHCLIAVRRTIAAWEPDYLAIARSVEQRHPDLHALLVTAVEQCADPVTGKLDFLQQRVVADAVAEMRRRDCVQTVPGWQLAGATALQFAMLALLGFSAAALRPSSENAPRPSRTGRGKK